MKNAIKNKFDETISVGDNVLFEMHETSQYLWPARVTKITKDGVWLLETSTIDTQDEILIDVFNIYKNKLPNKKIVQ